MNIIILEDLKGFRKVVEVVRFTPTYDIAEYEPITVELFDHSKTYPDPRSKIIRFYPKGEPRKEFGTNILLYKQME